MPSRSAWWTNTRGLRLIRSLLDAFWQPLIQSVGWAVTPGTSFINMDIAANPWTMKSGTPTITFRDIWVFSGTLSGTFWAFSGTLKILIYTIILNFVTFFFINIFSNQSYCYKDIVTSFLSSFADDTRVGHAIASKEDMTQLQTDLETVYCWAVRNTLTSLNSSDTAQRSHH